MNIDLWPLFAYSLIVVLLIVGLLVASAFLGQKRKDHATHDVYESGQLSVGSANLKLNVPFYRTAILFIIFDLEAVFLIAWAISIRESGWLGFVEVFVFIFILIAGLFYLWRCGALEWRTARQRRDLSRLKGEGGVVNTGPAVERAARKQAQGHGHDAHDHGHQDHVHTGAAH